MNGKENSLLRFGSLCILVGGIAANLLSIFSGAATMLAMSVMDESTLSSLNNYILQESDGMLGSSKALNAAAAAVIIVFVFAAIGLIMSITVGIMGLSRSKNSQKYKFFLGWGVVLLIIGLISMGHVFSIRGIFSAIGGIAGPIMYIIGGIQQNKAANADSSNDM